MKLLSIIILMLVSLSAFSQKLVKAEYFIDTDPGFGNGVDIILPNDSLADINLNADISSLSGGLHTFMLRAKNDSGLWSTVCSRNFMVVTSTQLQLKPVSRVEYFIDTDPGYGNATVIPVTPDTLIDASVALDVTTVSAGAHILVIRAQDSAGVWSQSYAQMFSKSNLGNQLMITNVEYFIDTDPGYGNGTALAITQDSILDENMNVSLASLNRGMHQIMFRARDEDNNWSETYSRVFIKASGGVSPNIVSAEYFVDVDPGYGQAIQVPYVPDSLIIDSLDIDLSMYSAGSHMLMMRALDEYGSWSETNARMFINSGNSLPPITKLEYFMDADPGYGNATAINLTPAVLQQENLSIDVTTVPAGMHVIHVRAQDSLLNWSQTHSRLVQVTQNTQPPDINALRYSFDTATVMRQGYSVAVGPDTLIDEVADLNVAGLSYGYHKVYFYAADVSAQLSLMNMDSICVGPQANFSSDTVCLGDTSFISDLTIGADTATVYQWDIENDGSIDYTSSGNIQYLFTTAGAHPVKLIVYNNITCADTIIGQILVNALPSVSVNATLMNICLGNSTTLTASGANTYNWSTAQTTAAITVSPAGDSTFTVTGTNTSGCSDTASVTIVVDQLPVSAFTPTNACLGTVSTFNNTSVNAVNYFWDFGDGFTSALPNPSHTYTAAGTFNVTLIAATASGCSDTSIASLTVLPLPVIAATASVYTICAGSNQSVTLTATGAPAYLWSTSAVTAVINVSPSATTTYSVNGTDTNGCVGTANVTVSVNTIQSLFKGDVFYKNNGTSVNITSGKVFIYNVDSVGITTASDSASILANGTFNMGGVPFGNYKIYVEPNKTIFPFLANTYYDLKYTWDSATVQQFSCGDTVYISIELDSVSPLLGTLNIGGTIRADNSYSGKTTVQGDPVPGVDVALEQHPGSVMLATSVTDVNGHYQFSNIPPTPAGSIYVIYANIPGFGLDSTYIIQVSNNQTHYDYFVSDSTIYIDSALAAIYNSVKHIDKANENTGFKVFPNPYKNATNISFELLSKSNVQLEIYNALGAKIAVLENTIKEAGVYNYTFSASDAGYSNGLYFAKLRINDSLSVARLIEIE